MEPPASHSFRYRVKAALLAQHLTVKITVDRYSLGGDEGKVNHLLRRVDSKKTAEPDDVSPTHIEALLKQAIRSALIGPYGLPGGKQLVFGVKGGLHGVIRQEESQV